MKKLFIILLLFGITNIHAQAQQDFLQKLKGYTNPEELVSLSETIPFNQAIEVLSKVSEKITGKKIVSLVEITKPIGIEIDKMAYKKALFIIVQYNDLVVEETETNLVVKKRDSGAANATTDQYASVDEREVKISAVLFEANVDEMRERGINWEVILSRSGLTIGSKLVTLQTQTTQTTDQTTTANQQEPPDYNVNSESSFNMGKFVGDATSMFRFFETENLGHIISMPSVTVVNGKEGRTQVGTDIAIKERDFAGNLIDKFYSTGTIITVTPHIFTEDGIDYVYLTAKIEKSSVQPSTTLTEINKTDASTKVLLLDGEETAIGGLFVNEESTVRRGVPFLKDLPWWVLGLRYIFGYDAKTTSKQEIIILLKVNILPSLKQRIEMKKENVNTLKNEWKERTNTIENLTKEIDKAKTEKKKEMEAAKNESPDNK